MEYVSAEWVESLPGQPPIIKAIGDDGVEYWVPSEDSDVPPWPQFIANGGIIAPAPPPPPDPPYTLPKIELWVRLTDPEAEQVSAAMATQPARMQGIWNSATEVVSDSEFFDDLETFLTAVLGETRAKEVLAPL